MQDKILVLDFGSQYNFLICRRIRDQHVYAELKSYAGITAAQIKEAGYKGIIFSGGPNSVYAEGAPKCDPEILNLGIPVLGLCYGHQLISLLNEGEVAPANSGSEFGRVEVETDPTSPLMKDIPEKWHCFMSHTDAVLKLPKGFKVIASTAMTENAGIANDERKIYGLQFHVEVAHTEYGTQILRNFVFNVCGCKESWFIQDYCKQSIEAIRSKVGDGKVLLALSGGVDSSVCAALLAEAVGKQLTCVFVDHGMMRKNEPQEVEDAFRSWDINFIHIHAEDRFLARLKGVTDPEAKRKAIGEEFIRVFEEVGKSIGSVDYLAQGTIYPDVVESGEGGNSVTIKSHHNVGGLPDYVDFKEIIEPLRMLFKDEVRALGKELGLPEYLVKRQPFPGPGLGIRVIGEVTKAKLDLLRDADAIFREEVEKANLDQPANQYFAVLTNTYSVGVIGDFRTYDATIALRSVTTDDFMTADWTHLPYEVLAAAGSRIPNEVKGVARVVYDITSKPPATVEWE